MDSVFFGLLVCWLLVCWFVGLLVCWFVGLLVCWMIIILETTVNSRLKSLQQYGISFCPAQPLGMLKPSSHKAAQACTVRISITHHAGCHRLSSRPSLRFIARGTAQHLTHSLMKLLYFCMPFLLPSHSSSYSHFQSSTGLNCNIGLVRLSLLRPWQSNEKYRA